MSVFDSWHKPVQPNLIRTINHIAKAVLHLLVHSIKETWQILGTNLLVSTPSRQDLNILNWLVAALLVFDGVREACPVAAVGGRVAHRARVSNVCCWGGCFILRLTFFGFHACCGRCAGWCCLRLIQA